jgi:hypothetical protein
MERNTEENLKPLTWLNCGHIYSSHQREEARQMLTRNMFAYHREVDQDGGTW